MYYLTSYNAQSHFKMMNNFGRQCIVEISITLPEEKKELFSLKRNENKSNCKDSAKILFNVLSALEEWNGTDVMKRSVSTWRCIEWWKCSKSLRVLICQNEAGSRPAARLMFLAERWQLAIQKWCDDNTHFYLIDIRIADVGRKSKRKSLGKRRPREKKISLLGGAGQCLLCFKLQTTYCWS